MRIVMVNDCAYVSTREKTNKRHLLNKSVSLSSFENSCYF